jgi:hypothetical protein
MKVKDLQLYKENNKYYLSALLDGEDKRGCYEVSIPKIRIPISFDCFVHNETDTCFGVPYRTVTTDLGFGELYVEPFDDDNNYYTMKVLSEKVHKMTLAEIEKELGYKIELQEENNK